MLFVEHNFGEQKKDDKEVIKRDNKEPREIDRIIVLDNMVEIFNKVYRDNLPFQTKKNQNPFYFKEKEIYKCLLLVNTFLTTKLNETKKKKPLGGRRSRESPWTLRYPGS